MIAVGLITIIQMISDYLYKKPSAQEPDIEAPAPKAPVETREMGTQTREIDSHWGRDHFAARAAEIELQLTLPVIPERCTRASTVRHTPIAVNTERLDLSTVNTEILDLNTREALLQYRFRTLMR
jgi:hypothetical protein